MKILEFKNNYEQEIIKSITLGIKIDWIQSRQSVVIFVEEIKIFFKKTFKFSSKTKIIFLWLSNFFDKLTLIHQNFSVPSRTNFKLDIKKVISELEKDLKEELAKDYLEIENPTISLMDITNINNQPIDQASSHPKLPPVL